MTLITGLDVAMVPIQELIEHPDNPRRGNVDAIVASIQQDGWHGVVVRQKSTGYLIVGNHRTRAARLCGMTELPVQTVDVDDRQAHRTLVKDNRLTDLGVFDDIALIGILTDLSVDPTELEGSGFTFTDVDMLLRSSGKLADGATGFLEEFAAGDDSGPEPGQERRTADGTFTLTYTVSGGQRDVVFAALAAAKQALGDSRETPVTSADALTAICRQHVGQR